MHWIKRHAPHAGQTGCRAGFGTRHVQLVIDRIDGQAQNIAQSCGNSRERSERRGIAVSSTSESMAQRAFLMRNLRSRSHCVFGLFLTRMRPSLTSRKGFFTLTGMCHDWCGKWNADKAAATILIIALVTGCTSAPTRPVTGYTTEIGAKAAHTATTMIGRPYKNNGNEPDGFDCSGLVRYSYLAAGMNVPHNTTALKNATRPVGSQDLQKGDLLFFNEQGKKYSHVGIFIGNNRFIHAPGAGKKVRKDSLSNPYWKKSFLEARRF